MSAEAPIAAPTQGEEAIWDWNVETGAVAFSARWRELFAYQDADLGHEREAWSTKVHPDDLARVSAQIADLLEGRSATYASEYRLRCKDGSYKWVLSRGIAVHRAADGKVLRVIGLHTDVPAERIDEHARREALARLAPAFEYASVAMAMATLDLRILKMNPACCELLGYGPDEMQGRPLSDFSYPGDWDENQAQLEELRDGAAAELAREKRYLHKDGHLVWGWLRTSVVRGPTGGPLFFIAQIVDITARKLAELREANRARVLTLLVSGSPLEDVLAEIVRGIEAKHPGVVGNVLLLDSAGTRIAAAVAPSLRPAAAQLLSGVSVAEAEGPCSDVLRSGQRVVAHDVLQDPRYERQRENAAAAGVGACWAEPILGDGGRVLGAMSFYRRRPGAPREAELSSLVAAAQLAAVAIQSHRAAAALHAQERQLTQILQSAHDGIVSVDDGGHVVVYNGAAAAMFGCPAASALGQPLARFLPGLDPGAAPGAHEALEGRRESGERFPVEASVSRVDVDGRPLTTLVLRDVSERRAAEAEREALAAQLRASQKMQAIGTLASGIAHDFNNLLMAVFAHLEILRDEVAVGHPARHSVEVIAEAAGRGSALVRQILAFSRQQPSERRRTSLRPLVERAVELVSVAGQAGVQVTVECASDVADVSVDVAQLEQVVVNLGTNAVHALRGGHGHIAFTLDTVVVDGVGPPPPGRYTRLSVRDDGVGMDAATRDRVFDPFFTTKAIGSGTGLGLSVAHGIVVEHGGTITVDSEPGRGTVVRVYLPAVGIGAGSAVSAASAVSGGRARIAYLDDEAILVRVAVTVLGKLGHRVSGFSSGAEALDVIRKDPGAYDVVVTDRSMPGMSGTELAEALAKVAPQLPVILVSGLLGEAGRLPPNIVHTLSKPYATAELAQLLRGLGGAE